MRTSFHFLVDPGIWIQAVHSVVDSNWHDLDKTTDDPLTKEVQEFIYGQGQNPFAEDKPGNLPLGIGTIKDAFEPNFERPNVHVDDLIKLGIRKPE